MRKRRRGFFPDRRRTKKSKTKAGHIGMKTRESPPCLWNLNKPSFGGNRAILSKANSSPHLGTGLSARYLGRASGSSTPREEAPKPALRRRAWRATVGRGNGTWRRGDGGWVGMRVAQVSQCFLARFPFSIITSPSERAGAHVRAGPRVAGCVHVIPPTRT